VTLETASLRKRSEVSTLDGKLGLDPNDPDNRTLIWKWHEGKLDKLGEFFKDVFEEVGEAFLSIEQPIRARMRVRITLKGHTIWSEHGNRLIYLDGQVFGTPAYQADGKSERIR